MIFKLAIAYLSLMPIIGYGIINKIEPVASFCDLKLPKNIIYKEGAEPHLYEGIKTNSNCTTTKISKIADALTSINGEIPTKYLKKIFKSHGVNLLVKTDSIIVETLESFIASNLASTYKQKIEKVKHRFKLKYIITEKNLLVDVDQENKQVSLRESGTDGSIVNIEKSDYDYQVEREVLIATKTLYPYSNEIKKKDSTKIEKRLLWSKDIHKPVSTKTKLSSYRLIKIVQGGTPIKASDLTLKVVIQTGKIVPVVHIINGLEIKTNGISRSSGKIGDIIEVKLKNSKIVNGIVQSGDEIYVKI